MGESPRLSEERLKLIRAFMGEEAEETPVPEEEPAPARLPAPLPSDVVPERRPARPRRRPARATQPARADRAHRLQHLWHRATLRWGLAAIALGVVVGALAGRHT